MDALLPGPADNRDLKRILDYLKISYWLVDMGFVLLDVNETFVELTGAERHRLVGRDMRTLISTEERRRVERIITALASGQEESIQFELYVYGRDMEKIPVLFHLSINTGAGGRPATCNALLVDNSGQKKIRDDLEKEKMMLQSILFDIRDRRPGTLHVRQPGKPRFAVRPQDAPAAARVRGAGQARVDRQRPAAPVRGRDPADLRPPGASVRFRRDAHRHHRQHPPGAERERELFHYRRQLRRHRLQTEMIGSGRKMQGVFETILRCAEVDSSVLIMGETGVGKEVAARAIHAQSHRREKPFVPVNYGALPEALLESEMFGHVRGAFTGTISDRAGLFREADEGTLFLDEIGELENAVEHALAMSRGPEITPECFPVQVLYPQSTALSGRPPAYGQAPVRGDRKERERRRIAEALERHDGNQTAAARELGISRVTLWRKKTMYDL